MKMDMGTITSDFNMEKTPSNLYIGDAHFSFPSLVVVNNDQKMFELDQFDLSSSCDISDGLFHSTVKTTLDKVLANGVKYGPGEIEISLKNLDAEVLARINNEAQRMQQGSEAERQQAMLTLLPELPKLFSKGAVFEMPKMFMVMPEGRIEGNFTISLPKGDDANPFQMMQKVTGQGHFKVPAVIVKQIMTQTFRQQLANQQVIPPNPADPNASVAPAPDYNMMAMQKTDAQLNAMVQNGVLTLDGQDYVIDFALNQGQLSVNGNPFSPAMLQMQ